MRTFNEDTVEFLKHLEPEDWYNILDKIFNHESLPYPISNNCEFISEYFLMLNDIIAKAQDSAFLNQFHTMLLRYYFDLPISNAYYQKIYTFHWIFANIKPKVELAKKLYNQLYSEDLNNLYYDNIHLNSSLLSTLHELPSIVDDQGICIYLLSSINRVNDYSFFRIALRYFIEKRSIDDYWDYFYKISHKYNNERFANVLANSFLDVKKRYGSFQKIYEKIDVLYKTYEPSFRQLFNMIINILNTKLLKRDELFKAGGKLENDIYAKLLKVFINSTQYPPNPAFLVEAWSELKQDQFLYINKLFTFESNWNINYPLRSESTYRNKGSEIITVDCDQEIWFFYQAVYNCEYKGEISGINPPGGLEYLIMKHEPKKQQYMERISQILGDKIMGEIIECEIIGLAA
jgi:hypothetical protein